LTNRVCFCLFHGLNDPNKLLLIFLVGETPASGVNRAAFRSAWRYAAELKGDPLPICPTPDCIGIVGPSFSGSLGGLRSLIDDLKKESDAEREAHPNDANVVADPKDIFLISGTATSPPEISHLPFHFCTAIGNDSNLLKALINFKEGVLWPGESGRVALLVEAETGYGAQVSKEIEGQPKAQD
jgi:hypothetical protein